jgi:hypothetical protein
MYMTAHFAIPLIPAALIGLGRATSTIVRPVTHG